MKHDELKAALIDNARRNKRRRHEIAGLAVDGKPLEAWLLPISATDLAKHGKGVVDQNPAVFVRVFIDKAQHENGDRIFTDQDWEWLGPIIDKDTLGEITRAVAATDIDDLQVAIRDETENSDGTSSD